MKTYKRLLSYVPEKIHLVYISIFLTTIATILNIGAYYFIWIFFKSVLVNSNNSYAFNTAIIILCMFIVYAIFYVAALLATHSVDFRLESNLKKEGLKHLINASFSFFDKNQSGSIRKKLDDNIGKTHNLIAHLIPDNIGAILTPILMFIICFKVDFIYGILIVVATIIGVILMIFMMGEKKFMAIYEEALNKMSANATEYIRGISVIKIFRCKLQYMKAFKDSIEDYSKKAYDYTKSCKKPYMAFQIFLNTYIFATIIIGIYQLNHGINPNLVLAKVLFISLFGGLLYQYLTKIMYVGMYNFQASSVVNDLEKLFMEMDDKKVEFGSNTNFESYNIEFKDVSFKYTDNYILKNFNLKLKEGKKYALVGSSGSGKTTIAKLLSGFYKLDGGEILIGNKPINNYSKESYVNNIAFVFQNTKLFKGSIYDNVLIGNKISTREEVMESIKKANCIDIIEKFKDRENTIIGSEGVYLSGGEIQRISIARAILKNAPIVILDEATAAADPENEYELQKSLSALMKEKTVIMIAHRLSSITNVDEILVIDNGEVVERGSHIELLEKNEKYAKLQKLYNTANNWEIKK